MRYFPPPSTMGKKALCPRFAKWSAGRGTSSCCCSDSGPESGLGSDPQQPPVHPSASLLQLLPLPPTHLLAGATWLWLRLGSVLDMEHMIVLFLPIQSAAQYCCIARQWLGFHVFGREGMQIQNNPPILRLYTWKIIKKHSSYI